MLEMIFSSSITNHFRNNVSSLKKANSIYDKETWMYKIIRSLVSTYFRQ